MKTFWIDHEQPGEFDHIHPKWRHLARQAKQERLLNLFFPVWDFWWCNN